MKETTVIKDIILERPSALVGLVQTPIRIIDGVAVMEELQLQEPDLMATTLVVTVVMCMLRLVLVLERLLLL